MKSGFKVLSIIGLAVMSLQVQAQTILEIGNSKISKDEFLKMYERNSVKGKANYNEAAIRDYMGYYTLYKMKLKEAEEQGIDTQTKVVREIESYKNQLVQSYLKDKSINEKLTQDAYNRLKEEIEVGHIFISFAMNGDSYLFKNEIDSIYKLVNDKKYTFEDAAKAFSKDKGTSANGGYLGYITALQTDYLFEDGIYNTKAGTISKPFKSSVGWHIVKVYNRRPNSGAVEVQQVLITAMESASEEKKKAAEEKLIQVNAEIKKGTSFDKLVATYSDDMHSKAKNGMLAPFRSGDLNKKIEDAAFGMKKPGDIVGPIKTEYGYHFLKLVRKIPLGTYEEMKDEVFRKLEHDQRMVAAYNARNEEVKKSIQYVANEDVLAAIKKSATTSKDFYDVLEQSEFKPDAVLFSIGTKKYTAREFVKYIETINKGRTLRLNNSDKIIDDFFGNYSARMISDVRYEKLYKENAEFRETLQSYKEGIIIFDMNQSKIWKRANDDTLGLVDFYQKNQGKYMWQPSVDGKVFQSTTKSDLDRLLAEIQSGSTPNAAFESLLIDTQNPVQIGIQEGRIELSKLNAKAEDLTPQKISKVFNNNGVYYLVFPYTVYPAIAPKSLQEAKGFVVSDYQEYLESEWVASLKKKYPVKVHESVLKTVFK